jgi:hypothetical protein
MNRMRSAALHDSVHGTNEHAVAEAECPLLRKRARAGRAIRLPLMAHADQRRPLVHLALASPSDGLAATTSFGCRFIDPKGWRRVCHICRTADLFLERVISAALWTYSDVQAQRGSEGTALFLPTYRRSAVMKIVIAAGATLALVTAAGAADLPRRQPVYQEAPVGKMPIGKTPVGKTPVGKTPVAPRPY